MQLADMTWPQVESYLQTSSTILIPIGSTEQHGPTGLISTDFLTADAIAREVGKRLQVIVAPPLCYGMAIHHLAFPGSMALTPQTYVAVIADLIASVKRHGFRCLYFINGHGGNMAPATTAFCQAKTANDDLEIALCNWWLLKDVRAYEEKAFGDANGSHATAGEVSVTQFVNPEAFKKIESRHFKAEIKDYHWPMSPEEFRRHFPDGRMESDPGLASIDHGRALFHAAVEQLCREVKK